IVNYIKIGERKNTQKVQLIYNIKMSLAKFEKNMIVEQKQKKKMIAKQEPDFREGRPKKYTKKQIEHAIKLKNTHTYKQVEELTGISKPTLYRALQKKREVDSI